MIFNYMSNLEILFTKIDYLQNASVKKIFKSKKHTVSLIKKEGNLFVLKWYNPKFRESFFQEYKILIDKHNFFLKPELIENNEKFQFLILDYIPGQNVCDQINNQNLTTEEKIEIIQKLAYWFYKFHSYYQQKSIPLIHGDAHLRNFIITKNKNIYGLDFEENKPGNINEDIASLCASILTTNPSFTEEKKHLKYQFVKRYETVTKYKLKYIETDIEQAVITSIERRKNNFN